MDESVLKRPCNQYGLASPEIVDKDSCIVYLSDTESFRCLFGVETYREIIPSATGNESVVTVFGIRVGECDLSLLYLLAVEQKEWVSGILLCLLGFNFDVEIVVNVSAYDAEDSHIIYGTGEVVHIEECRAV